MYLNGLLSEEIRDGHRIHYSYDSYDHLAAIQYYFEDNQTFALYYVTTNAQGDVLGLYTGAGVQVASYEYDAWGNVISMTDTTSFGIATINPIRYRGYYFDEETGWYYLQSRYYAPEIGRFINADIVTDGAAGVLGNNIFIYAANNPVNNIDSTGQWIIKDALKWLTKNVFQPITEFVQESTSKINRTKTKGFSASATSGVGASASAGITTDTQGNIGFIVTTGAVGGTPAAGISGFQTQTTAPDIYEQRGMSYSFGGSADVYGIGVGGEYTLFTDAETHDILYHGGTVFAGIGAPIPLEFHTTVSHSWVWGFNVYEQLDKLYISIMEW